jgi:hypothetical protein
MHESYETVLDLPYHKSFDSAPRYDIENPDHVKIFQWTFDIGLFHRLDLLLSQDVENVLVFVGENHAQHLGRVLVNLGFHGADMANAPIQTGQLNPQNPFQASRIKVESRRENVQFA